MDRPWWTYVIQWGLWAVVMTVVMGWLARSRLKKRAGKNADELHHPTGVLILGVIGTLFFVVLAIGSIVLISGTGSWLATAIFLAFVPLGALLLLEYFRVHHRLAVNGLHYGKLFGSGGFMRWADVRQVDYSLMMKWFIIKTHFGRTIRISAMLVGLPEFARAVLANVPANVIEPETRPILEATANGNPPSIWG